MAKKVILLTNLGSPDSTSVKDVRRYLNEFLMDERVIDVPYLGRLLLVRGIITPFRAPKSAAKYRTIWTDEGSPLIVITNELAEKVEKHSGLPVYVCMRYANPTPAYAFKQILSEHSDVEEVTLFPLYPHYAMSSYETAVEHVKNAHRIGDYGFKLNVVAPYYNHNGYIDALVATLKPYLVKGKYDRILFSYHGIPERHIFKTDPTGSHCLKAENCCSVESPAHEKCYRHQVLETTRLVAGKLSLTESNYLVSFQSRLGTDKWLTPATSDVLKDLPSKGVKKLLVISPAFVSDCLETLEEIHEEGRETFIEAGGELYDTIPCLNSNDDWVETIVDLVNKV
ncbi:ferrochelatase [Alkalitalea saponilacus]|uniref:Ferrochelatase n=1 Tax=Alkalitalea saponilacus TaxID=889453 RepID=A0A1T5EXL9_9BACT|nr:ferrochelatase [Alkalitalea saponilacus]ASB47980.1 ferrochelatase [Alkalitalea saponilacus]SKB88598.1 ferrochelatase [Alkalitalea saponilacus]